MSGEQEQTAAPPQWRRIAAPVLTVLACVLVLLALILPNDPSKLTLAAFLRIPMEALVGLALILVLPPRPRRVAAVIVGVLVALLVVAKVVDMGFYMVLDRPFNPVFDWSLFVAGMTFAIDSFGRVGAVGAVVAAAVLALALLVLMPLAVLRVSRLLAPHRTTALRTAGAFGAAWVALALLGAQIVPDVPVAAQNINRLVQVGVSLQDNQGFAQELPVDAYEDLPGHQLLTGLRGKDVVLAFVESYGRNAVEDEAFDATVGATLEVGDGRLRRAGFGSRSAFLTSPTVGGASWLAHATLLSGLWVDNQQRYHTLTGSDRFTMNQAFQRAGWRTTAVMPGVTQEWPEGEFFGYDRIYDAHQLRYSGPWFNWARMPDQYTLSAFERFERRRVDEPVMSEIALITSHAPWTPIPELVRWDEVGNGTVFEGMTERGESAEAILGNRTKARTEYGRAISYTLRSLITYVETYGDDDLVLIFVGDHQPTRLITGDHATRDVPITIVAKDPAVLDQISGWGWHDGLRPRPDAPVWPMDEFRDEFFDAYGGPQG